MFENDKKKMFNNPRWNQDPGAKVVAKDIKITKKQKKWAEEQSKKWKENLKKLKEIKNTQK